MINDVRVAGHLGRDPEVRTTPNGATSATFSIACTERWTDQSGQKQERTEWVTCVAWRKDAELAQMFLRKGSRAYVEGKLQTRTWEDKNGGGKRSATEVVVKRILLLDKREQGERQEPGTRSPERVPNPQRSSDDQPGTVDDDDLPF